MQIPIVLYDENNERVGETYHRRAKQLVRSGRAVWLDDGQSLLMTSCQAPETVTLPPTKEDLPIMTEIYTNNGTAPIMPEAPPPAPEAPNELRMYLARRNVARKRNLIKNIVAYILVWVLILVPISATRVTHSTVAIGSTVENEIMRFSQPFVHEMPNTGGNWVRGNRASAQEFRLHQSDFIPESFVFGNEIRRWIYPFDNIIEAYVIENIEQHIASAIESSISGTWVAPINTAHFEAVPHFATTTARVRTQPNSLWFFVVGIMFAWGIWILARGISISRQTLQSRPKPPTKPDPIALEYQRLSNVDNHL